MSGKPCAPDNHLVNQRLREANPPAEQEIRDRLADLRRRGLWESRLNSAALLDEALTRMRERGVGGGR